MSCADDVLVLPHPYAHERAFVLIPWLALDPSATLTLHGQARSVAQLVTEIAANIRSVQTGGALLQEIDKATGY